MSKQPVSASELETILVKCRISKKTKKKLQKFAIDRESTLEEIGGEALELFADKIKENGEQQ